VDLEEFDKECRLAREASDADEAFIHLLRAESLYQGDFLEEDVFEFWCAEDRARIKALYLSVLASIIEYHECRKDYSRVIESCNRYLQADPYAEDMYQRLMRYYAGQGNNAMVKKIYERYSEAICRELKCPLSKETELIYRELVLER